MSERPRTSLREGVRLGLPFALAVLLFGVSFGVLARSAGMGVLAPIVFSATSFAGSAQFAALSVLSSGGSVAAAVGAGVLLNARYGPMGLAAAPSFVGGRLRRLIESQVVVDEGWALANRGEDGFDRSVLLGAGVTVYAAWLSGTAVGVLAGDALGDPEALGLDAAFPALFFALLLGQLTSRRAMSAALLGGAIAIVLLPFTPPGVPVIAATAGCLVGLRRSGGKDRA